MRDLFVLSSVSLVVTFIVLLVTNLSFAQTMSSSNFKVQSDSVNFGGGYSNSTNYQMESTVGEIATGDSSSASYTTLAGFQQMQSTYISLSASGDVSLTPSIPGVSGGTANGSTSITVITDSLGGYQLTIQSENSPAMQSGGNSIADYVPFNAYPDLDFQTSAADAQFGFSPEGTDIVERYLDDGLECGQLGAFDDGVDICWDGSSTTPITIARGASSNHPTGTQTVIKFRVGIGGSVVQPAGSYVATTTVTATAL